MNTYKETVTTRHGDAVDSTGARIHQKTREVDTESPAEDKLTATNVVWYIVGVIEAALALRFLLKIFGANPSNGFVDFVYTVTGVLTAPFDNIFNVARTTAGDVHSVFEPSIIVAAVVYLLIGWGIVKLININHSN